MNRTVYSIVIVYLNFVIISSSRSMPWSVAVEWCFVLYYNYYCYCCKWVEVGRYVEKYCDISPILIISVSYRRFRYHFFQYINIVSVIGEILVISGYFIILFPTFLHYLYPLGWHTLPLHAIAEACLTGWPNT